MEQLETIRYFATNRNAQDLARLAPQVNERLDEPLKDPRDLRIKLQRGGFYFADMRTYMAFYLGEVDDEVMPADAIVADSADLVFKNFLASKKIKQVVICVHGFNVHLNAAHTWFRTLFETMKGNPQYENRIVGDPESPLLDSADDDSLTAFIGFSWPSNGNVLSYPSDQRDAASAAGALANLIARIHLLEKPVSLLCHSMGNFAACHMLKGLIDKQVIPYYTTPRGMDDVAIPGGVAAHRRKMKAISELWERGKKNADESVERDAFLIENFVMLAPDVERRHVVKSKGLTSESQYVGQFYSGLQHLVRRVTNVYSRFDSALNISNIEKLPREAALSVGDRLSSWTFGLLDFLERNPDQKWEKRLGSAAHPLNAPPNFTSVNATQIAGRSIDHGDHIDNDLLVAIIAESLDI